MVFEADLREEVEERLRLPAGAQVDQLCAGGSAESPVGRYSVTCSVEEGGVLVHRLELTVPPQRIPAELYPDFAAFLRGYDEAAATETRVVMPVAE